jgi:hypothetical protein
MKGDAHLRVCRIGRRGSVTMKQRSMFWVLVCCVSVGGWLVGCGHHGHDRDAAAEGAEPAFEEAAAIVEVSPEMEAVLARADLAEGRVENDVTGALMALAETEGSDSEATP